MMNFTLDFAALIGLIVLAAAILSSAIRILREYERAVLFTLGRYTKVIGPGFVLVIPIIQQIQKVQLRTVVVDVPTQDVISRDNVSV
jgi:regulator of protease activity HflC (stomatin/prohibitin superfamily)